MSTDSSVPNDFLGAAVTVMWARHKRLRLAHAFTDLSAGDKGVVEPIKHCATYPHPDVIRDDLAERCVVCQRAVARWEATR